MVILEVGCSGFEVRKRELRGHRADSRNRSSSLEARVMRREIRTGGGVNGSGGRETTKRKSTPAPFEIPNAKGAPRKIVS